MSLAKALPLIAVLLLATRPDEGQWLPSQLREMDWERLRARGMLIDKDEFWHPERGGLLNAAVQIGVEDRGNCSAAFVSPGGLVITNHHCGDDAIGKLSTLKRNIQKEGFMARSREQELPTNMVVHVVRGIRNVTAEVHAAQARGQNALERYEYAQAEIQRLVTEGEKDPETGQKDPMTTCHVASFFEGREYHLYYRTRITDIRLVYAPPKDTADYGGNVDNWEWPRHSGDFVLFRTYVAPDGTPRAYARDNVPYRPDHFIKVSTAGVREGDLVMIVGYPGQTVRYLSSVAVEAWQGYRFPKRQEILADLIEVLEDSIQGDPQRQLEMSATLSAFTNIEKNHVGMIQGLARNAVVERKIREEEAFTAWARRTGRADFVDVLQDLLDLDHDEKVMVEKDLLIRFLLFQRLRDMIPLLTALENLVRSAKDSEEGEEITYPENLVADIASDAVTADLDRLQKPLLEVLLEEARNLPKGQRLAGTEVLADSDVPSYEMVDQLLAESRMLSGQARVALLRAGRKAIAASQDPLIRLVRGLVTEIDEYRVRSHTLLGRRMVVGPRWIEAQQQWRGQAFYPDANSTIRVSIAEVRGYRPRDAVDYGPFTTVAGMLEKETGVTPFKMPEELKEAARRRWLSQFRNKDLDDVPVCFLANGDTTNGNSGSPVINGRGQLVGLNFDRVFENVAGDFGWNADRSRNISLDIRFVLWHLESVMPAPHLLREMGVR